MQHLRIHRHMARPVLNLFVLLAILSSSILLSQSTALAVAVPTATLNVPTEGFVGEAFSFTVTFDNTSGIPIDTGYGPYIDLILPKTGVDGAGAQADDGITFVDATYLGQAVTATVIEFDINGEALHPYAVDSNGDPLVVTGTPGDDLVVLLLPFGSFTQGQPAAEVTVNVNLSNWADVGTPLNISASAGFQFGEDAQDNPASDPSITGATTTASFTPTLFTLTKTYIGPEDETATGPNFPREYLITVDIADGQTLTNLDLTDVLPDNLQFVQVDETTIRGSFTSTDAIATPSTSTPGGTLTRRFASVTGTTATNDATMRFTFYVPRDDASAARVLDPDTGDDVLSIDDAATTANWDPLDARDPQGPVQSDVTPNDHTLTDKSIAIQKSVVNVGDVPPTGNTPGDTLEYTLNFQISDFFAFESIVITDTFSDGQRWDTTFVPELSVNGNPWTLNTADFDVANYNVDETNIGNDDLPETDGSTTVFFRVSDEMITRGQNGTLLGGCIPPGGTGGPAPDCTLPNGNNGPTTGTVTFRTVIQDEYSDTFPSGDPSLNENDALSNSVLIDGRLLAEDNLAPTGFSEDDDSGAGVNIAQGTLQKTVYAVNDTINPPLPVRIAPGDQVTYRLRYDLVFGDFESFTLSDFLPLPVFFVDDPAFNGSAGAAWNFDSTGAATPPTGEWKRGPADTQFDRSEVVLGTGIVPTTTVDVDANSLIFDYGTFEDPNNVPTTIDILFTVTASDEPFADRLFLTNQVRQSDQNTQNQITTRDAIVQIELTQPVIAGVQKGVIATNNAGATFSPTTVGPVSFSAPGTSGVRWSGTITSSALDSTPIDSNLSGVDAGDLVSFAIVVENEGSGINGAFDVQIRDTIPTGFVIPSGGYNLSVTDGTGAPFSITNLGAVDAGGSSLFGAGIELVDPGPTNLPAGALDPDNTAGTSGRNIVVITYDLQVANDVAPEAVLTNTATVFRYAGDDGAPDHIDDLTDDATVTVKSPGIDKTINGTNQAHTLGNDVAIGEILTYNVSITVPEGLSANAQLVDTLDAGLVFVDCLGITASADLATDIGGGYASICSGASVTNQGRTATFNFGNITNSNRNNAVAEVITLSYRVVVINSGDNDRGDTLNNSASWEWDTGTVVDSAPDVTIVEPTLSVDKSASPTTGDAGDEITYTIVVNHAAASNADTFDVVLSDTIPSNLTYVGGSLSVTAGTSPDIGPTISGDLIEATWNTFPQGTTTTIQFRATLDQDVQPGEEITNRADVTYTSLPGDETTAQTGNSAVSTERTGDTTDPGSNANNYFATDNAPVTVTSVALTKSIIDTSEADTTGNNVTIGEVVRYRLIASVPEGTSPDFQIRDLLPPGLTFFNDGTATVAFVANGTGIASSTLDSNLTGCGGLYLSGASGAVTPTCPLPDTAISSAAGSNNDTYSTGTDVYFKMGDLVNADSDADLEYVVVEFNVLVDNTVDGSNDAGETRNNRFRVTIDGTQNGIDSGNATVTIVEPSITNVDKTITTTPSDAGDTVSYSVTFANTGTSTAYNVLFTDTLPADIALDLGSVNIVLGGGASGSTDNSSSNTVAFSVDAIPVNGTVTVTYDATLSLNVMPGQQINNQADVTYTSLPGTGTTGNPTGSNTPGGTGDEDGERDGSGGINDYSDNDPASFTVALPQLTKIIVETSEDHTANADVAIGEIVRYQLTATLPEGTSNAVNLVDTLPAGYILLDPAQVRVSFVANSSFGADNDLSGADNDAIPPTFVLPSNRISTNGQEVTFDLGTLVNNDSDAGAESIVLEFNALVQNVAVNNDGDTKTNSFQLTINGMDRGNPGTVDTTIVEPSITDLDKSVTATPQDAGNLVVYTVTYSNDGSTTAFEVNLTDALPAALTLQTPVTITLSNGATGATDNTSGNNVDITVATVPVNGAVTVAYAATVNNTVTPLQVIDNTADITYTSLPGGGTGSNPTGSTTPGSSGQSNGERNGNSDSDPVNDYRDSDPASLTIGGPAILKQLDGTSAAHTTDPDVTIGEVITYALTITLPEGRTPSLVITDSLPAGLAYVAGSLALDTNNFAGTLPAEPPLISAAGGSGDDVVLTFLDDVVVTADNDPSNNSFVIRLRALVLDEVGNVGLPNNQTSLPNSASLQEGNNSPISTNPVTVQVVEPQMIIAKTLTPSEAARNDTITITLAVDNIGLSTAYDVIIEDPLSSITYTNVSEVSTPAGFTFSTDSSSTPGVTLVRYTGGDIPVGEQRLFTFTAQLTTAAVPGDVYTNVATVTQATTLPGSDPNERDEPDVDDQDDVTVITPDLTLTKTDGLTVLEPGQTTVYTLTVQNVGTSAATGVVISDTVPTGTTFDTAGSTTGWSCADNAPAGTVCTYTIGDVTISQIVNVLFAVTVDLPPANNITTIVNTATVDDDGSQGDDPTPGNNTDDDTDQLVISTLGDRVWEDTNANGVQDAGEPGIPGVEITLSNGLTTTTDTNGIYTFTVAAGTYTVTVDVPSGYEISPQNSGSDDTADSDIDSSGVSDSVILQSNDNNPTVDAGLYRPASLGDRVWEDLNADGIQDPDELGIPGVEITLSNGLTTTTDANGIYTFTNLVPGTYTVTVDVPAGYLVSPQDSGSDDTADSDIDSTGVATPVTLVSGENNPTIDAGLYQPASLGDRVWEDLNADGIQDPGELGIPGVEITLSNGLTTTTDANGIYTFTNLVPGAYTVTVDVPAGYVVSPQDSGTDDAADSDVDSSGVATPVTLVSGENNPTVDAGLYQPASLGDRVWNDVNGDGIQDQGEPGIPGVEITLSNGLTTTTDANGIYTFTNLVPGTYTVTVDVPAGYVVSPQDSGSDDAADSDVDSSGVATPVTLVSGENNPTIDAGLYEAASLGDRVWEDLDADGIQDPGEPGIPGVEITLSNGLTTTTDANGIYTFTVAPGTYTVTVDVPGAYLISPQDIGSDDAADSDIDSSGVATPVTLVSGENNPTVDAGLYRLASLGDRVWEDLDADGIQDPDEPGIPGVVITLSNGLTTTTDAGGFYAFINLAPGTYTVTVDVPAGYLVSPQDSGTDDAADSDIDTGGVATPVTLVSGENNPTIDAGLYQLVNVGDTVWFDYNGDGIDTADEPGIPGVTVNLLDSLGSVISTTVTGPDGMYLFPDLLPGAYTVAVEPSTLPAGLVNTYDLDGNRDSSATAVVPSGQDNLNFDFGYNAPPQLDATKVDALLADNDNNLAASPGDTLRYTVIITNTGLAPATDVRFNDTPGRYTTLIAGSVTTTQGSVVRGNGNGERQVIVDVGTLAVGAQVTIVFDVRIADTIPADVTHVANQGIVSSSELPETPTDDPDTSTPDDPTLTPIRSEPALVLSKQVTLDVDADNNGVPSPGDTLRYSITVQSTGNTTALGLVLTDTLDVNTTLVVGSVTTTQGTVQQGNTSGDVNVVVLIGDMAPGGQTLVGYNATINDPLPAGVNELLNQALVTGSNVPPTVTDDPLTPVVDDPTGTHVGSQIALDAFKEAQLLDDADNNSQPSAGDTLLYRVTILNKGNVNAPSVTFTDTPDANTTLVVGSVKTTQGAVITGNNGGDTSVAVDVGDMAAQQVVVVTFHVRINTPLPDTVKEVANQGIVDSPSDNCDTPTGDCTTPTDDPTTPAVDDPTITPLITPPSLTVSKQLSSSPLVKIGDLLTYTIRITNTGRTIITRLPLTDTYSVDYLKYVSAVPAADTVDVDNGVARWNDLTTFFGDLLPGESFTVTTVMMALGATPDGVQASNRATVVVVADEFDQPGGSGEDDFDIVVAPNLILTKSRLGPAQVEVGEEITYSIRITNVGNTVIVTLPLSDTYDSQVLSYVRGQPAADRAQPGRVEWFDLTTTFNDLQPNASIEVVTVFTASQAISNTVNLAQVIDAVDELGNNVSTEDSDTVTIASPTVVTLLSFTATPEGNALRVSWVTGAEVDSWGFHLWRSETDRREDAVRVTGQMIPALGNASQGASYAYVDGSVVLGVTYHYWLEETEVDGERHQYGPIKGRVSVPGDGIQDNTTIFLPWVRATESQSSTP